MITAKQYTETYERYTRMLQKNAERIVKSSETRKYLIKNSTEAPLVELLAQAVNCIADLTGDECFRKEVINNLERRR